MDFCGNISGAGSKIIFYDYTDIGTVADFEIDVLEYDGIVAIADDE